MKNEWFKECVKIFEKNVLRSWKVSENNYSREWLGSAPSGVLSARDKRDTATAEGPPPRICLPETGTEPGPPSGGMEVACCVRGPSGDVLGDQVIPIPWIHPHPTPLRSHISQRAYCNSIYWLLNYIVQASSSRQTNHFPELNIITNLFQR